MDQFLLKIKEQKQSKEGLDDWGRIGEWMDGGKRDGRWVDMKMGGGEEKEGRGGGGRGEEKKGGEGGGRLLLGLERVDSHNTVLFLLLQLSTFTL